MGYEIVFDPDAVKDLKKLDRAVQQRLVDFLKRALRRWTTQESLIRLLNYRVGDWRIACDIQDRRFVVRV